jgi:hypothetical protein
LLDYSQIEKKLVFEIKLTNIQAKIFLLVVIEGKMTAKHLMEFGAFIDVLNNEFEAMHPRFTAVNMYRKMCEREKIEFKKNLTVDNIGVSLEKPYDDARTKYNKSK